MPAIASASARRSWVIFIEQNFGPHIEQKCATLCASLGSVSSWYLSAVSGSSERWNWSIQRKSKQFLEQGGALYVKAAE